MAVTRHEFSLQNGNKFYIRKYDAFLSLRVLGEVQKKFLVALTSLMEAQDASLSEEAKERNLFKAIDSISKSLDGDSIVALVKQVLNPEFISASIEGEPPEKLDEGMLNRSTDSLFDVLSIVFEVLKVNYTELFTRGRTLIGMESPQGVVH
jgi:Phage tail assembly chaperone protein, TAC